MVAVSTISWEEVADPAFGHPARQAFRAAVAEVADKAKLTLPECNGRVDAAVKLVLAGDVELLDGGTARVASGYSAQTTYVVDAETCECKDFAKAPSNWCKHRIAFGLMRRAVKRADALLTGAVVDAEAVTAVVPVPPPTPAALLPESLLPYVVHIKGKAFVQYGGLLTLAQERGLVSLKAEFLTVTAELALAKAEAVFADGRTYLECSDATPGNVGAQVRPHFARIALTRAKSRVLRDALGITMVALEELGDD